MKNCPAFQFLWCWHVKTLKLNLKTIHNADRSLEFKGQNIYSSLFFAQKTTWCKSHTLFRKRCSYGRNNGDKELGAVGSRAPVGHAERVGAVVPQCGVELVLEFSAPDALPSHPRSSGVPRLDHEALCGGGGRRSR